MINNYLTFMFYTGLLVWLYLYFVKTPFFAYRYIKSEQNDVFAKYENSRVQEILISSFPIAGLLLLLKLFWYDLISIPSESMLPAFPVGASAIVDKTEYGVRSPLTGMPMSKGRYPFYGEAVITKFPLNPEILYIKRVIGLPGDTISMSEKGIVINGILHPFKFVEIRTLNIQGEDIAHDIYEVNFEGKSVLYAVNPSKGISNLKEVFIEKDMFFLLGDNLTASSDSRNFGPIPWHYFVGSVLGNK